MRWSRLRSLVEDLFVPGLRLQLHCTGIREAARRDPQTGVSRGVFQVRLGREIIWDFPGQFHDDGDGCSAAELTALLRDYLDTPKAGLMTTEFAGDRHGLGDLLRVADRRIGRRRLRERFEEDERPFIRRVLVERQRVLARVDQSR